MNEAEQALVILRDLQARMTRIEAAIPNIQPQPVEDGKLDLSDFVRGGDPRDSRYFGVRMTTVDPAEMVTRACWNINWQGGIALGDADRNKRWELIEKLKAVKSPLDPIVQPYRALDPALCGVALLTNLIPPFEERPAFIPWEPEKEFPANSIEGFIAEQLAIAAGGATPGFAEPEPEPGIDPAPSGERHR